MKNCKFDVKMTYPKSSDVTPILSPTACHIHPPALHSIPCTQLFSTPSAYITQVSTKSIWAPKLITTANTTALSSGLHKRNILLSSNTIPQSLKPLSSPTNIAVLFFSFSPSLSLSLSFHLLQQEDGEPGYKEPHLRWHPTPFQV
jgi:hypothetical protein